MKRKTRLGWMPEYGLIETRKRVVINGRKVILHGWGKIEDSRSASMKRRYARFRTRFAAIHPDPQSTNDRPKGAIGRK